MNACFVISFTTLKLDEKCQQINYLSVIIIYLFFKKALSNLFSSILLYLYFSSFAQLCKIKDSLANTCVKTLLPTNYLIYNY